MKKILGLTVIAILAISLVGGGTWAYFSDTENSNANSIAAGTLDLKIDGGDAAVYTFQVTNKAPGDSGSGSNILSNAGNLSGELDIAFSAITNTGASGEGEFQDESGDLGGAAKIAAYVDVDQSGTWNTGDIGLKSDGTKYNWAAEVSLDYQTINSYGSKSYDAVETMAAATTDNIVILWQIPTSAGNEIQGDSVSFNVTFTLQQAAAD